MSLNKFLWILFFGSLIGLNETFIGSFNMPYRSVVLSTITIAILSIARSQMPKMGSSLLIILVAILYKINSVGIYSCTTNFLLCGPTALLTLGVCYELFASVITAKRTFNYLNCLLVCSISSIAAFSLFGIMNTYILNVWGPSRLIEYIFIRGLSTALLSSAVSILALFSIKAFRAINAKKLNPYLLQGILSSTIILLWVFGYYSAK